MNTVRSDEFAKKGPRWRGVSLAILCAVLLVCSGCAPLSLGSHRSGPSSEGQGGLGADDGDPDEGSGSAPAELTLTEAREYQNRVLEELAAFVPPEVVVRNNGPIEKMKGMRCDWYKGTRSAGADAGVMLPGGQYVGVKPGTDLDAVREAMAEHYRTEPGWEVNWEQHEGWRTLALDSPDGYGFYVSAYRVDSADPELGMSSFSPCMKAPEGFTLFDKY